MKFKGITVVDSDINSFCDLGLIMIGGPVISTPEVQENYITIPGRDGKLCLNTALDGKVHFLNRTYEVRFFMNRNGQDFQTRLSDILTLFHGKTLKISSDYDEEYYYTGEWKVSDIDYEKGIITITGDVQPYKVSILDGSKSL